MNPSKLTGLIAATYTPFDENGSVNESVIEPMVDRLLDSNIQGLYVCGSTGEGMSLSSDERKLVAEAYVNAAKGRVPVIVQVGHNSLKEAQDLARHAEHIKADMISATCPSYFKVADTESLIACMQEIAGAAPTLPFYYYHIPLLTGSSIDMPSFLTQAAAAIPNLVGLKYTDTKLFEFQECVELGTSSGFTSAPLDVVWGCDEMLLGALATGAQGAIGSTYNIAAPLYTRLINAFEAGDMPSARQHQSQSIQLIRTLNQYPFHAAMKAVLAMQGLTVGDCRLPQGRLSANDASSLQTKLESIGFFDWGNATTN